MFWAGVLIAFLFTIPLVNLITPIVATAFMVHVFELIRESGWKPRGEFHVPPAAPVRGPFDTSAA